MLLIKLGYFLKTLVAIIRTLSNKEENDAMVEKCRRFVEIFDDEWEIINANSYATMEKEKENLPVELPLEGDVRKVKGYCCDQIVSICHLAETVGLNSQTYLQLSRVTLCRLITFNARRGGEPSKLTLKVWDGVMDDRWKRLSDMKNIEDDVERKLATRMKLCYIHGKAKRGRKGRSLVPVLFTEEVTKAIQVMLKFRSAAGVAGANPYVFATTADDKKDYSKSFLRGWDTMQQVAGNIKLEKPQLLTPTRQRKNLCTMMQLLDMTDAEMSWLTDHMGHSKNVHLTWYRQEESTVELTKVAKVLLSLDQGQDIKNKKINALKPNVDSNVGKNFIHK